MCMKLVPRLHACKHNKDIVHIWKCVLDLSVKYSRQYIYFPLKYPVLLYMCISTLASSKVYTVIVTHWLGYRDEFHSVECIQQDAQQSPYKKLN